MVGRLGERGREPEVAREPSARVQELQAFGADVVVGGVDEVARVLGARERKLSYEPGEPHGGLGARAGHAGVAQLQHGGKIGLVADLPLANEPQPERGDRRERRLRERDALREREPLRRDVALGHLTDDRERVDVLDREQFQPLFDREPVEVRGGRERERAERLRLLVRAREQRLRAARRKPGEISRVGLRQKRRRELAHGPASRLAQHAKQILEAAAPRSRMKRRGLELGELAPLRDANAVRAAVEHRRLAVERVHQPPRVEQPLGPVERRVLVADERGANRATVAIRVAVPEPPEVAEGAAREVPPRPDREAPRARRRREPGRDRALPSEHLLDDHAARRRIPAPPLDEPAARQAVEGHEEATHQLVVPAKLRELEQRLDERPVAAPVAPVVDVGEHRLTRERPRVGVERPGHVLQLVRDPAREELAQEPAVARSEVLVEQQGGCVCIAVGHATWIPLRLKIPLPKPRFAHCFADAT